MPKPGEHKTVRARILEYAELLGLDEALWDYVIVHELLHFFVPNHGRLWKSLMQVHLGNYESMEAELARHG